MRHKNLSRDGVFVDPAFTRASAAKIHMDAKFRATVDGPTYATPLYFEGGPGGKDIVITSTVQNKVYALDAATGDTIWQKQLAPPVAKANLPCGNMDPLGITGTPVIDAASRTLFVDAMTTPDRGATKKHLVFALSLDDGSTRSGWPLDVSATVKAGGNAFVSAVQHQRGALLLVNGTVYVPYGGHWGDCGDFHGWVVGIPIQAPRAARGFATAGRGAGIWAPGGIASDGVSIFATTGNTLGASSWAGGEAVLRLSPGPVFSGRPQDYFAPSDWKELDGKDWDLGGSGPVLVDVPGANPSKLVVALGKNGVAYLVDRANMGGIGKGNGMTGEGVSSLRVASNQIIQAATAYTTSKGTYVAFNAVGRCPIDAYVDLSAFKISATSPPAISLAWCQSQGGFGSPITTTTDGHSEAVVWGMGDNRLRAYDGDDGHKLFEGGGPNDGMKSVQKWQSPIVAKGRMFVAADNGVYAFTPQ
jgi:outer membrane protein assembly factor BamB